jgi:glutamate 5-kinase
LPVGVTRVDGEFERGEPVAVIAPDGQPIARGLTSYESEAIRKLRGTKSAQIVDILGYSYGDAVIHRNNMVLLR